MQILADEINKNKIDIQLHHSHKFLSVKKAYLVGCGLSSCVTSIQSPSPSVCTVSVITINSKSIFLQQVVADVSLFLQLFLFVHKCFTTIKITAFVLFPLTPQQGKKMFLCDYIAMTTRVIMVIFHCSVTL